MAAFKRLWYYVPDYHNFVVCERRHISAVTWVKHVCFRWLYKRKFKNLWRGRQGQRRRKNEFLFRLRISWHSICSSNWIWNTAYKLRNVNLKKISAVVYVFQNWHAEFGQFTLLFCRRRQRNVPRIITHGAQPLYCSWNLLYNDVVAAVVVSLTP